MRFARARAVADAVLFEGYALYPYRASSTKNHLRWQFGVLAPPPRPGDGGEPWWCETQCLVEPEDGGRVAGRVRFLRVRRRRLQTAAGAPLERIDVDGRLLVAWDEGEVQEIAFAHALGTPAAEVPFALAGDTERETVRDAAGEVAAEVVRTRAPLCGTVRVRVEPVAAPTPCVRLVVRVENGSVRPPSGDARDRGLPASLVGTHLLLAADDARFVSLIDPPAWARQAARACKNVGLFPVLAGAPGQRDLVLSAPIILYDHPAVAPESAGDLFDATEIDEILTLRTRLLTDEEKRQARATDARVAALVDRVDGLPAAALARLHGAFRDVAGGPAGALGPGARVRLRPGPRRSDAQDLFLAGLVATVRAVRRDVENRPMLAVTIDDDPGAELHAAQGRYHYFYLDEVEPLGDAGA